MTTTSDVEAPPALAHSDVLLAAAQPSLYRTNAFRVTGLPVTASMRELERHTEKLRMAEKLGVTPQIVRLLPLEPAPDAEALREALQQLRDPERRLVDELFWFWPLAGGEPDEALACLSRGDVEGAADTWRAWKDGEAGVIAGHNLAVLGHALALDAELEAMEGTLAASQRQQRDVYWQLALRGWARLAKQEPLWERVSARVRDLDDPRLTADTVAGLRQTLPVAVLAIVGELAARSAEAGNLEDARRLARLMNSSGFPDPAVREAQLRAATPLRKRIFALCESAESQADADPQNADQAAEQLAVQTAPLLDALDALLADGHSTREAVHDEVALRLLACLILYGNSVQDWQRSIELLQPALRAAASITARGRIRQNLEIVERNYALDLHSRIMEFCQSAAAEATADPKRADRTAERLLAQTQALLATLDSSVASGHPVREEAHDAVALHLLACQVQHGNETKDWKRSIAPLRQALAVAASAEARERIQESLATLEHNLAVGQCFFCADSGPYEHADLEVSLYRVTGTRGTFIEGEGCSRNVPRCRACRSAHGRSKRVTGSGIVLGALAGLVACAAVPDEGCAGFMLFIVLVAAGAGIGKMVGAAFRSKGVKPPRAALHYAPVSELLAAGWSLGTELSER